MYFRLAEGAEDVSISILDEDGNEIVTHSKDDLALKYATPEDMSSGAGLNRFVWDMRYPLPSTIPGRAPTPIQPIAKPGRYTAMLTVDGVSQARDFHILMNPHEPYTQAEADAGFEFWMDLYGTVDASSRDVIEAVKLRDDVATRLEAFKGSGASDRAIANAEEKAEAVTALVNEYEGSFVAVGRTLAEIINLPAKIFTKAIWLHNMMEVTEGPSTQPMRDAFERLKAERDVANERYRSQISAALEEFENSIAGD